MSEKIIITNNKDKKVGLKDRGKVDYDNDIYRVSALWIVNNKDEVLIAKRASNKGKDPGKWGPAVAGTVSQGETYKSNIYKEAREELSLNKIEPEKGPKQRFYEPHNFFCQWFVLNLNKSTYEFIKNDEVEQIAWIQKDKLLRDVKENSDKYIPTMKKIVELFIN